MAQIPPPPFSGFELWVLDVRMYGLVIALGAFIALRWAVARFSTWGGDPDLAEKALLIGLGVGFLGGRVGYLIPRFLTDGAHGEAYIGRPLDLFAIWQGGLAFYGGLTGGLLAVIVYMRIKRADLPGLADAAAPALPLAQAFGRWGNYFNQELFGLPTDLPWALRVDPGPAERAGFPGATTFHPTFLYESLWNLGLVGVILLIEKRNLLRRRGSLLFVYLIGYGIGRGWIETLRVDTVERYFGLSRNNWVSLLVIVIGIVGLLWWERREPATPHHGTDHPEGTDHAEGAAPGERTGPGDESAGGERTGSADDAAPHTD